MDRLSDEQIQFVKSRKRFVGLWGRVGTLMIIIWLGGYLYCFFRLPHLANPFELLKNLEAGQVPDEILILLAAFAPVLFMTIAVLVLILLILGFAISRTQSRLIDIIDEQGRVLDQKSFSQTKHHGRDDAL